ncbi:MAG: spore coat protein U domain-containing protein [Limnohabitans sp.]
MRQTTLAFCCALFAGPTLAAVSCTLGATSVLGVYDATLDLDLSGSVTVQCTRALNDASTFSYTVTLDDGLTTGLRELYQHGGSSSNSGTRLSHDISMAHFGGLSWTASAGNVVSGTLNFGSGASTSASHIYYLRVPRGQLAKAAGIYDDILTFRLLAGSIPSAAIASTTITPTVSILNACFVGQLGSGALAAPGAVAPSTLILNYESFSPSPVSNSMLFTIDCTLGTPYSLSLSPATGVLLGLPYRLSLSSNSGTGTGFAQNVVVTGTVESGLSGNCAQSSCQAVQPTTVTITY